MGTVLRDTGAFFMRRSYNDDYLYWETFKQYIHQITTKGDLPIEFFIEGTRSRSCKSLVPKFGKVATFINFNDKWEHYFFEFTKYIFLFFNINLNTVH